MVAITVILAATIGTFVLGLGEQVEQNARAAVNADVDADADEVRITLTTLDNSNYVFVSGDWDAFSGDIETPQGTVTPTGNGGAISLNQTGSTVIASGSDGDSGTLVVVAVIGGNPAINPNGGVIDPANIEDQATESVTQTTVQQVDFDL
jgi:FlaG/FlaF family flagellin (archaellin)